MTGNRAGMVTGSALAATTVSFGLNFSAGVFFAPVAETYGVDGAALAAAAAVATGVTGLAQPLVGKLLDRFGPKRVLLTALAVLSTSYLALALAQETWQFLAAYVALGGLGFAGSSSLAVSTLIARAHGADSGPALAQAAVGINLGQVAFPWMAITLFDPAGVRSTYAALGAAGMLVTIVLVATLPPTPRARQVGAGHEGRIDRQRLTGQARVLAAFGLHAASLYAVVLLLPKHASELGWSSADAGWLVAVSAIASGIGSAVMSRLVRRRDPEPLLLFLHLLRASSLGLAAVVTDPRALIVVALAFGAASFPVIPLTMAAVSRRLDPARLGRSLAPAWVLHQFSAGLGLAGAAALHALSGSYRGFFAVAVALSLIAALLLSPVGRTTRHVLRRQAPTTNES